MKLKRTTVSNFLIFDEVDLTFDDDIYFIVGENRDETSQDSNGSGKSALMQAIGWCLFEDMRKGVLKDDVVRTGQKWCSVRVEIEHDGNEFVIERFRKHPKRKNNVVIHKNGTPISKHSSDNSNKLIETELGVTAKMFYHCCYSDEQAVKPSFASLTPGKMLESVVEILDIERFNVELKLLKERTDGKKVEFSQLENKALSATAVTDSLRTDIEDLRVQLDIFDEQKEAEVKAKQTKISQLETKMSLIGVDDDDMSTVSHLQDQIAEIGVTSQDVDEARRALDVCTRELQSLGVERTKYEKQLATAENAFNSTQEQIDNLRLNDDCKYCGNKIQDSSDLKERKARLVPIAKQQSTDVYSIKARVNKAARAWEKKNQEHTGLEEALTTARHQYGRVEEIMEMISVKEEVGRQREYLSEKILDLQSDIREIRDRKPESLQGLLAKKKKALKQAVADAELIFSEIDEVEAELRCCKIVDKIIRKMKAGVLNTFIFNLSQQINDNLRDFTDGDFSCNLNYQKDNLNLEFTNTSKDGQYYPYSVFSRGERVRISKAVSFALAQIMESELLIEDEGLSGLDAAGVYSIIDFMIANSENRKLFFVSHDQKVIDYFDDYPIIKVVKDGGSATAEIVRR